MTQRIFRSILFVAGIVLLLSLFGITGVLYRNFSDEQRARLREEAVLAVEGVESNGIEFLLGLSMDDVRITWVAQDGTVLYDTKVKATSMDNHGLREEIQKAMKDGTGESSRYSTTLFEKTHYYAVRAEDGSVLRVSSSLESVFLLLFRVLLPVSIVFLLSVVLSGVLAKRMARQIVNPLNELNLEYPLENDAYEELSPILGKMNKQRKQIADQVALLKRKKEEFEQTIDSMNEGVVLLDENRKVISMNTMAVRLFEIQTEWKKMDFLTAVRRPETIRAVEEAYLGKQNQFRLQKNGREYQFDVSCIRSENKILGVALYVFDVTEQVFAERNRREFTANVSHELKTPLQSIIGSAELLESGLVKPEDTARFVGHIRSEASRLVTLINDIIRLSQLDENEEIPMETVDLCEVALEVTEVLKPLAVSKNVSLTVNGTSTIMNGIRRYLYEIIYNLCDNSIRYNKEGGRVIVNISKEENRIVLKVADTGIGIATEHHARIFERFYRVDKSHSKETGGTGLGLSIVKHAVQYHGGQLKVESTPGQGTAVTIEF